MKVLNCCLLVSSLLVIACLISFVNIENKKPEVRNNLINCPPPLDFSEKVADSYVVVYIMIFVVCCLLAKGVINRLWK